MKESHVRGSTGKPHTEQRYEKGALGGDLCTGPRHLAGAVLFGSAHRCEQLEAGSATACSTGDWK